MSPEHASLYRVSLHLGDRSHEVLIGSDLLSDPTVWISLASKATALIVTNVRVGPLYASKLREQLNSVFDRVLLLELPDGEAHKEWPTLQLIFDRLLGEACDRKTVLFALGGGVVGDITGFAAASYMRGISFVQVPTTLLAQVDSSVGGKTAINHPLGKNMIGAFHQPLMVVCDLSTLQTLPARELSAGLAEVIKYGPIADEAFFAWLEARMDGLTARRLEDLAYAVKRCCEIKAAVVGQDERESGLRAILNFGHTFGHAIEAGMGYGQWLHGEAIAVGMVMAADLSACLGLVPPGFVQRLSKLIERAGLPVRGPALHVQRFIDLMRVDKKAEHGAIRFVVIAGVGQARLQTAPDAMVAEVVARHLA
jgi:3-dehydroquinate synthase